MAKKKQNNIERQVHAVLAMAETEGWKILREMMQGYVDEISVMIIEKEKDGEALSDLEVDQMRYKHRFMKRLIDMPEKFAEQLRVSTEPIENYDPYYTDPKEMIKKRKK